LVERGRDDGDVEVGHLWVAPFSLVAVILFTLILAVFLFYIYHQETLVMIALLLLLAFALSLRTIQTIKAFRPRRKQSQTGYLQGFFFLGVSRAHVWVWG
jgi:hypothetical protein